MGSQIRWVFEFYTVNPPQLYKSIVMVCATPQLFVLFHCSTTDKKHQPAQTNLTPSTPKLNVSEPPECLGERTKRIKPWRWTLQEVAFNIELWGQGVRDSYWLKGILSIYFFKVHRLHNIFSLNIKSNILICSSLGLDTLPVYARLLFP